jgi:hypothetical protein
LERGREVGTTVRKKIAYALAVSALSVMTFSAPAFGHQAGKCPEDPDGDDPGHSEVAEHHVVPAAQEGALGEGGHNPGEHQGFSACDPSGRE